MIDDYYLAQAGLIPPGFRLRARSREERQEFTAHREWTIRALDGEEEIPSSRVMTGWVDWELHITERVMHEEDCWHYGMPDEAGLLFNRVRQEIGRRTTLAARRTSIYKD